MKFLVSSLLLIGSVFGKLKDGECEVCISVVNKFIKNADEAKATSMDDIKKVVKTTCKDLKQRENRFVSNKSHKNEDRCECNRWLR